MITNERLAEIQAIAENEWQKASHDLVQCAGGEVTQTDIVEYVADQLASMPGLEDWRDLMYTDRHCLLCNWFPVGACL